MEKRKKQAFNPYLPSYEYIPDGEPHVFGDRIYIYGSHDRFDGANYCLNDYVCYSADIKNLKDWKYEGIIYRKEQDPRNQNIPENAPIYKTARREIKITRENAANPPGIHAMWAPDVVRGLDGKYYLYYCLDCLPEIAVAVCDNPAGKYEFLGFVKHQDGTILGNRKGDRHQFDPGIFIDDDNSIYLYSGSDYNHKENFKPDKGSMVMKLYPDMLTIDEEPKRLMPNIMESEGTGYEGHEFFEASSIRKVNGKYYFVYSSIHCHELCYAISDKPDKDYHFGGTLVDIGDVFLDGREEKDARNSLGNTHGGIECADGQWYVFYHRQTNRTDFSRQGCAEKIYFEPDGSIKQVEVTSCGLNAGALEGKGIYPARIACCLTRNGHNVWSTPSAMKDDYPYFTQDLDDMEYSEEAQEMESQFPVQYIRNIQNDTTIGYKYFDFGGVKEISLKLRGKGKGCFFISITEEEKCGKMKVDVDSKEWVEISGNISIPRGVHALYFTYEGSGKLDMVTFTLK